jgi:hypothetical protein
VEATKHPVLKTKDCPPNLRLVAGFYDASLKMRVDLRILDALLLADHIFASRRLSVGHQRREWSDPFHRLKLRTRA